MLLLIRKVFKDRKHTTDGSTIFNLVRNLDSDEEGYKPRIWSNLGRKQFRIVKLNSSSWNSFLSFYNLGLYNPMFKIWFINQNPKIEIKSILDLNFLSPNFDLRTLMQN